MNFKTSLTLAIPIFLWSSAFVGIRFGLTQYSPEGLALLRFIVASLCMAILYFSLPARSTMLVKDRVGLLVAGAIGIGIYNLALNYGERSISSGVASFITSQAPIVTIILAVVFLGEQFKLSTLTGLAISTIGLILITSSDFASFRADNSLFFIGIATLTGGCYSILQKPFVAKYHAIQTTSWLVWGGGLFLLFYLPSLRHDLFNASLAGTVTVIYLGIFPAALGYLAWSYTLAAMPASRAVSYLYLMPFIATLLGWLCLGEVPALSALFGGIIATLGVWMINRVYQTDRNGR